MVCGSTVLRRLQLRFLIQLFHLLFLLCNVLNSFNSFAMRIELFCVLSFDWGVLLLLVLRVLLAVELLKVSWAASWQVQVAGW